MTLAQQIIIIVLCALATQITRFLPFAVFSEKRKTPQFIEYIGKWLPSAVFGLLVIYCLKDISFISGTHGLPELIAIAVTVIVHLIFRQMLVSIAAGTIVYMLLVHFIFI